MLGWLGCDLVTYAPQEAVGRGVLLGPERVGVLTDELQTVLQSVKQSRAAMRQRSIADPAVSVRASARCLRVQAAVGAAARSGCKHFTEHQLCRRPGNTHTHTHLISTDCPSSHPHTLHFSLTLSGGSSVLSLCSSWPLSRTSFLRACQRLKNTAMRPVGNRQSLEYT